MQIHRGAKRIVRCGSFPVTIRLVVETGYFGDAARRDGRQTPPMRREAGRFPTIFFGIMVPKTGNYVIYPDDSKEVR